jgi:glucan 1,6-alpha-glucosidase
VWGEFELLEETADEVFAYMRSYQEEKWLIVANFSSTENKFFSSFDMGEVVIQNYPHTIKDVREIILKPYEAFVVKIK